MNDISQEEQINGHPRQSIGIEVELEADGMPKMIHWKAGGEQGSARAMFLQLFDQDTMRLDLWAKEFSVGEMDLFVFQVLHGMADSYGSATGRQELAAQIHELAQSIGYQCGILLSETKKD
jgi:gliding motility-associated protein GldC